MSKKKPNVKIVGHDPTKEGPERPPIKPNVSHEQLFNSHVILEAEVNYLHNTINAILDDLDVVGTQLGNLRVKIRNTMAASPLNKAQPVNNPPRQNPNREPAKK